MKEYKVKELIVLPPPSKDPNLGKTSDNPAKSCIDLKLNSIAVKSGIYYLKSGNKPAFKAYCDMETDNGGWTLFYNYVHHPG